MIRVTVELIPFGTGIPQKIGEMLIANDGTGTSGKGNYDAVLRGKSGKGRRARVEGFPRARKHVWYLIQRVLNDVY